MVRTTNILVVEDDSSLAAGLRELLRAEGYGVTLAADGDVALGKILRKPPGIVLLDVNLPGMTGLEVCRRARASGFRNPIIMVSARSDPIDRVVGLEAGADDYVPKPFNGHEVLARIRAHVRVMERFGKRPSAPHRRHAAGEGARSLLAVMFTDMEGFSKKMHADEAVAIKALKKQSQLVRDAVRRARGRVVEVVGDGCMVSFRSGLQAVRCAVAIQRSLKRRNAGLPRRTQLRLRIGIHIGDVVMDGRRLRGDTVNVAARLQQLCAPGAICISESVLESVRARLESPATAMGSIRLKNIRHPVEVYRLTV